MILAQITIIIATTATTATIMATTTTRARAIIVAAASKEAPEGVGADTQEAAAITPMAAEGNTTIMIIVERVHREVSPTRSKIS